MMTDYDDAPGKLQAPAQRQARNLEPKRRGAIGQSKVAFQWCAFGTLG